MSRRTDSDAPTITAAYPRLLLGLLEERGLDGRALLREIGLSTLRLEEPEARVTSQQYQAIAAAALALSGDPGLGAQLALRTPPTAHGSLGYAMMTSATLGDALCLALRYMPLLQGNVEISLLREDEQVILRMLPGPALPPALHRYFSEALLIGLYRSGAWLLGEPALVGRLDFDYPEPAVPVPLPQCRYDQPTSSWCSRHPARPLATDGRSGCVAPRPRTLRARTGAARCRPPGHLRPRAAGAGTPGTALPQPGGSSRAPAPVQPQPQAASA